MRKLQIRRPDLPDSCCRCSWPPDLRFIRPPISGDGRLRTVTRNALENTSDQGGDDDGKGTGDPRSQAMDACFVTLSGGVASDSR